MKKKILYIAAIVICLSLITGGTYAYFTTSDTARNVITTGGIGVNVMEMQQMVDGTLQPWPSQPIPVMPGTTVSKIVSVQCIEQAVWVRMNYTLTVYAADGTEMEIPADELAKVIIIDPDTSSWTQKDGWWYYTAAIASGETSKPLFEEVVFSGPEMDNKYQSCTVVINVTAQTVQKANNGATVWEALGWPET